MALALAFFSVCVCLVLGECVARPPRYGSVFKATVRVVVYMVVNGCTAVANCGQLIENRRPVRVAPQNPTSSWLSV